MIKVLLVDDEKFVMEQIRKSIDWGQQGMEIIGCCANAVDALELMQDEMPDILVTDIKMPVMNGLELIDKAKKMNSSIECVILSGYSEFSFAKAAVECGAVAYLLKPFSVEEFMRILQKCIYRIREKHSAWNVKLEQRIELVEKLELELWELLENDNQVDLGAVRDLMQGCSDISLLRDAVLTLMSKKKVKSNEYSTYISNTSKTGADICQETVKLLANLTLENGNNSELVRKVKDYTEMHYQDEGLNLQVIAEKELYMGVKYIGRSFLKETGIRYSQYLLRIRMEKAIELMQSDNYRVDDIAEKIGLGHDVPYFYQQFKKYTGKTPKEYSTAGLK